MTHNPFLPIETGEEQACLVRTALKCWQDCPLQIDFGLIALCTRGKARISADLSEWPIGTGTVLMLYPDETVCLQSRSDDFEIEGLACSDSFLREASIRMEQTVYDSIRADRKRPSSLGVAEMLRETLALLATHKWSSGGHHWAEVAMLQLKAFFLAYDDYLIRQPVRPNRRASQSMHSHFAAFMREIESHYKTVRDVASYAERLNITPKYLNTVTRTITHHTPKELIDHLLMTQLKLRLRTTRTSIKELSNEFGFSSQNFFTRYFKLHAGLTPREYRRTKS